MSTRTEEFVLGNETVIAVNKTDADPAVMVTIQCATSVSFSSSVDTQDLVCYAGEKTLPSGRKPKATATINGNVKEYASAIQAANVSARDLYGWHKNKTRKLFTIARPHEGDTIYTAYGYITQFGEEGAAEGTPQTWSATITFEGPLTPSVVAGP